MKDGQSLYFTNFGRFDAYLVLSASPGNLIIARDVRPLFVPQGCIPVSVPASSKVRVRRDDPQLRGIAAGEFTYAVKPRMHGRGRAIEIRKPRATDFPSGLPPESDGVSFAFAIVE